MYFQNSFYFRLLLFAGSLLATMCLHATAAAAAEPITFAEALRRTEQGNPKLAAQRLGLRASDALIEQADIRPNPTLDLEMENFAGSGTRQGFDKLEATLQATQRIERGDKRSHRVALANAHHDVAHRTLSLRLTQLRQQTATAYIEALVAQHRVSLAQEILTSTQSLHDAIADRVTAGRISPAESARARAALVTARVALGQAESKLENAHATLAVNWGGESIDFTLAGKLPSVAALPDQSALLDKLESHTQLDLQRSEISRRQVALDLQHAEAKSDVTVGGGVRFYNDRSDAAFVAGVSWALPFRNQNQGNIRAAREELAAAEKSTDGIRNDLRHAFTTTWQDLIAAHRAARTLRDEALPAIDEVYTITREAYDQGQIPMLALVEAARERVGMARQVLTSEADYARALVQLDALTDPTFPLTTAFISSP